MSQSNNYSILKPTVQRVFDHQWPKKILSVSQLYAASLFHGVHNYYILCYSNLSLYAAPLSHDAITTIKCFGTSPHMANFHLPCNKS